MLPDDYKKLAFDRESDKKTPLYILKPNALSCGKGITVLGPQDQIPKKGGFLVSKYIANPHLIDGLKYDLRIYVLVTSYDPLKVYLFREGLTRFATEKYSTNLNSLKKRYVHLTNYSVNKRNVEGYVKNNDKAGDVSMAVTSDAADGQSSSKWNLLQLKSQFEKMGLDYRGTKQKIKDVIIKTLISVEPHIVNNQQRCTKHRNVCFEVYGFDILLDSKLKPWLLEVNISPSLSSSSPLDKKIKTMLICDTLNLVGVTAYDRKRLQKEQDIANRNRLLGINDKPSQFDVTPNKQVGGGSVEFPSNYHVSRILKTLQKKLPVGVMTELPNQLQSVNEDDIQIIVDFEEEQLRRGNFDLIYPLAANVNYYMQFFEQQRWGNELLWRFLVNQAAANGGSPTSA